MRRSTISDSMQKRIAFFSGKKPKDISTKERISINVNKSLIQKKIEKTENDINKTEILRRSETISNVLKDINEIKKEKTICNLNPNLPDTINDQKRFKETKIKLKNILKRIKSLQSFEKDEKNIVNIIYLIDTTYSMKKYKNFIIDSISGINKELINKCKKNIKIGYVLYKDYKKKNAKETSIFSDHAKIYLPSKMNLNLPKDIEFSGGYDYGEDWLAPINKISELTNEKEINIVIHIADSNAHGARFSDYELPEEENNEAKFLIEALKQCQKKQIRFIGFCMNDFARKSFFECKKIYNQLKGFYDIIDFTKIGINVNYLKSYIIEKLVNFNQWDIKEDFDIIDESNFNFKGYEVKMKSLYEIQNIKYHFLPNIEIYDINGFLQKINAINKNLGIQQGYLGDCYLISSILSMLNHPLIFSYIFPNQLGSDERTQKIDMIIYENGIKKLISFNNTYATFQNQLLFSKPCNNEIYGIALEKGYVITKCSDNTIKSGYEKVEGGFGYQVFEKILGAKSEKFTSGKNFSNWGFNYINRDNLKCKIVKYINFGGIITFDVFYNLGSAHEYSLQGYKFNSNGDIFIEIINPHRKGRYSEENIYYSEDEKKEKLSALKNPKYPNIYEDDFINEECKNSLKSYKSTGYLIMEFETFFKWYGTINMCDPMIGSYEQMIEYIPNGKNIHSFEFEIKNETKFRAYIYMEKKEINFSNYNIILKHKNGNIIYDDELNFGNKIIYEKLKKGIYIIEIITNDSSEIKDTVYLKIQYYDQVFELSNNNNEIIIYGYKWEKIYYQQIFIRKFIYCFYFFITNNKIDLIEMPSEKSIYYCCKQENIINNFYIIYLNTSFGYYAIVIYKYTWTYVLIIEYRNEYYNYYNIYTKYGKFRCSRDFYFCDFDEYFIKSIFNNEYKSSILWSEKIEISEKKDILMF